MELILVGLALESATRSDSSRLTAGRDALATLVERLNSPDAMDAVLSVVEAEGDTYDAGGSVTYFAGRYLLDLFADTTERTPTFALPAFERSDHPDDEPSLAFAKHKSLATPAAWTEMLQREPKGLAWTAQTFRSLGAPNALVQNPPDVAGRTCLAYTIGNESVAARVVRRPSLALPLQLGADRGTIPDSLAVAFDGIRPFALPLEFASSPMDLEGHLACKLMVNYVSTLSSARLGRLMGNRMIYVLPSNNKLIDRCIRIVADLGRTDYRRAAHLIFAEMEEIEPAKGISPVPGALRRLGVEIP